MVNWIQIRRVAEKPNTRVGRGPAHFLRRLSLVINLWPELKRFDGRLSGEEATGQESGF